MRAVCDKNKLLSDDNLKLAFELFDTHKNGCVTWNDINTIVFKGKNMNEELINDYLSELGITKDQVMDFKVFCELMRSLIPKK